MHMNILLLRFFFYTSILLQQISGAFAFRLGYPSLTVTVMVSEVERIMCLSPWQLGSLGLISSQEASVGI